MYNFYKNSSTKTYKITQIVINFAYLNKKYTQSLHF